MIARVPYQLLERLAAGGMGEVYRARAGGHGKTVVLKRLLPQFAQDRRSMELFLAEAKLAAKLSHPNVVQVFDFGEEAGAYFLVMEHVDGPSLRQLARRAFEVGRPLGFATAAKIISHACEGLSYAHDLHDPDTGRPLQLVHRDVSLENILIARNGTVKVADFGIAHVATSAGGAVQGKSSYLAPEQLSGHPPDLRSDVFALGVCLFELLTGSKPYESPAAPVRKLTELRPGVPPLLEAIVGRALEKDLTLRYHDCQKLHTDLEAFLSSSGEQVTPFALAETVAALADEPKPAPVRRSRLAPFALAVVLGAAATFAVLAWLHHR